MLTCLFLLLVVHVWSFWQREIHFYRRPSFIRHGGPGVVLSPVCGRVMYIRRGKPYELQPEEKQGRKLPVPPSLNPDMIYTHIGIFMTPLDNHHLMQPGMNRKLVGTAYISGLYNFMWEKEDSRLMMMGVWWVNWWDRKLEKFIAVNARTRFYFSGGMVADLIYDKYVNKITMFTLDRRERKILGFVHRGSQVDMFIPDDCMVGEHGFYPSVSLGEKVTFDTELGVFNQ